MTHPYPSPENMTGIGDVFIYSNNVTYGALGISYAILIFITAFILLKIKGIYKTSDIMGLSALISIILSSFIWILGIVKGNVMLMLVVILAFSVIWSILEER